MPAFLLSAAALFWGQQTGLPVFGFVAAIVVEAHRAVRPFELSGSDFRRLSYLCTAAFIAMSAYVVLTRPLGTAVMTAVEWFPIVCLPLVAAQKISSRGRIPAQSLFPILDRMFGKRISDKAIDVTYPFLAACVFAASAANVQTFWFYAAMLFISAWALWFAKPRTTKAEIWLAVFVAAAAIGYAGHVGLHALQGSVERTFGSFVPGGGAGTVNSVRNTAIGSIGTLKLSNRIALRVRPAEGQPPVLPHGHLYVIFRFAMDRRRFRFDASPACTGSAFSATEASGHSTGPS